MEELSRDAEILAGLIVNLNMRLEMITSHSITDELKMEKIKGKMHYYLETSSADAQAIARDIELILRSVKEESR